MKQVVCALIFSLLSLFSFAQEHNPYHQSLADQIKKTNITNYLTEFENFGEKSLGSTAGGQALDWLTSFYESWGYTNIETQKVTAFDHSGYNLIVTKTGTVFPDTFIIIDAHYDTINGPGTNDNGSGTSILLEIARVLANVKSEYSIKFIHFTGEEWGLYGSYKYVDNIAVPQDLDIKLVFNIDEVGGVAGLNNNKVVCEADYSAPVNNNNDSALVTQELATCIELYSNLGTTFNAAYSSDYVPFQENGFVITGLYEYHESPYTHSQDDTLENMDTEYVYQLAKGSLGALGYFAKVYQDMSILDNSNQNLNIFPNPADNFIQINTPELNFPAMIQLIDTNGKIVLKMNRKTNKTIQLNTSTLPNGIYILKINQFSQKIIVQHK